MSGLVSYASRQIHAGDLSVEPSLGLALMLRLLGYREQTRGPYRCMALNGLLGVIHFRVVTEVILRRTDRDKCLTNVVRSSEIEPT